jgi:hypothetical protein
VKWGGFPPFQTRFATCLLPDRAGRFWAEVSHKIAVVPAAAGSEPDAGDDPS